MAQIKIFAGHAELDANALWSRFRPNERDNSEYDRAIGGA